MSKISSVTITCPECSHSQAVEVYSSINVTLDPKLRDEFSSHRINIFECEKCGLKQPVETDFMYHDMKNKFIVYVIPDGNFEAKQAELNTMPSFGDVGAYFKTPLYVHNYQDGLSMIHLCEENGTPKNAHDLDKLYELLTEVKKKQNQEKSSDLVQKYLDVAASHHSVGEEKEALEYFDKAFQVLTEEASNYAHNQSGVIEDAEEDGEKVRRILPALFEQAKSYLQRDSTAYLILKNMAVIQHKFGDITGAINSLEQAIELAPPGSDTSDVENGLSNLKGIVSDKENPEQQMDTTLNREPFDLLDAYYDEGYEWASEVLKICGPITGVRSDLVPHALAMIVDDFIYLVLGYPKREWETILDEALGDHTEAWEQICVIRTEIFKKLTEKIGRDAISTSLEKMTEARDLEEPDITFIRMSDEQRFKLANFVSNGLGY